jgi:predicted amidohydrolase YtcJ
MAILRVNDFPFFSSLSGLLIDNAQDLIKKPAPTDDDLMKLFNRTMQDAVSVGLTSIHDAGLDPMSLAFFKR